MAFGVRGLLDEPADAGAACTTAELFLRDWLPDLVLPQRADDVASGSVELPTALRWAYSRLGLAGGRLFHQDPLVHAERLAVDRTGVVPFRVEAQGCVEWGFPADAGDDPPVLVKHNMATGSPAWQEYQSRLSLHILDGVLSEAVMSGPYAANAELTEEARAPLDHLSTLGIPRHPFWPDHERDLAVTWRGLPEAIVRNDGDTWLWALGRSREDLQRLMDAIPGDWVLAES